ncbi:MAG: hypothetical protein KJO81_04505 [Gammaproteobacteria bacterium]|nr:hypothetical protein [Gammaproteobacteria bacterium]
MKQYSLDNVKQAFQSWRALRSGRCATPDYLKERTISLLKRHSRQEICEELKINHRALNSWQEAYQENNNDGFINLPLEPEYASSSTPAIVLKIRTPLGMECELSGDFDIGFITQMISSLHIGGAQ